MHISGTLAKLTSFTHKVNKLKTKKPNNKQTERKLISRAGSLQPAAKKLCIPSSIAHEKEISTISHTSNFIGEKITMRKISRLPAIKERREKNERGNFLAGSH